MPEIDDEIQRTREALRAVKQVPRGETIEQTSKRLARTFVLRNKLAELKDEKAQEYREQIINRIVESDAVGDSTTESSSSKTVERRAIVGELRAKGRRLVGYAATFGAEAKIGNFTETIAKGAFSASLAERDDILALVDHDPGRVLARTRSGSLRLSEDDRGLAFDLDVPATTIGNDVLALAERGDIGGASFAFTVKREKWDGERRTLESVDLHEVSVVSAWPAYEGTIVQARARTLSSDLTMQPRAAVARRYLESL
jgi:uncharacterized protein